MHTLMHGDFDLIELPTLPLPQILRLQTSHGLQYPIQLSISKRIRQDSIAFNREQHGLR